MASRWRKLAGGVAWRRTMGPVVVEVEKWHAHDLYGWRMGTVDRRGTFSVLMRRGTGRDGDPGIRYSDAARVAAEDAAIAWARSIIAADEPSKAVRRG